MAQKKGAPPHDVLERPRGGQGKLRCYCRAPRSEWCRARGNRRGAVTTKKPLCIEAASSEDAPLPVWAVSGSMVQKRKLPVQPKASRVAELRWQRQADATDPSRWTQVALARMVGASVRSVKAWEAGDTVPREFHRRRLAKIFGVNVEELGF